MSSPSFLEWALRYYDAGLNILPLKPRSKEPRAGFSWQKYEHERIPRRVLEQAWKDQPDGNIGLITGYVSGITVIDIDWAKNKNGMKDPSISIPLERFLDRLPISMTSITGSGGYHRFFRYADIPCSAGYIHKQVDIKSQGGYVVLAPSVHDKTGLNYAWDTLFPFHEENLGTALAEVPAKIIELANREKRVDLGKLSEGFSAGSRNVSMAKFIGSMLHRMSFEQAWRMTMTFNQANVSPPLSERECWRIYQSISRREYGKHPRR